MRVTLGELRKLIREAVEPHMEKKVTAIVNAIVDVADDVAQSVRSGNVVRGSVDELNDLAERSASLAKFLARYDDEKADAISRLADLANELVKQTSFWARPAFLGKDEHAKRVNKIVMQIHNAQVEVVTN